MTHLRSELEQIAQAFVDSLLRVFATAPVRQLENEVGRPRGVDRTNRRTGKSQVERAAGVAVHGRGRRSRGQVAEQKQAVLAAAHSLPPGFRKRDVAQRAGSTASLSRLLGLLVAEGKLRREGDRNATRYWVRG